MIITDILLNRHPRLDLIELNILNRYLEVTDMQDFTKASKRDIETKQVVSNITAETKIDLAKMPNLLNPPETSFIKARLNKDNFWNLMFLTLPCIPIFIAQKTIGLIPGGIFLLLATLILSPYLVSRANKVEYKDNMFRSVATKRALGQYAPEATGFVLWLAIPFTVFWVIYVKHHLLKNLAVYNIIFWFVPTAYFILKNLPISIIFNKIAWTKGENNHSDVSSRNGQGRNKSLLSLDRMRNDPINSWSSTNIYHKR